MQLVIIHTVARGNTYRGLVIDAATGAKLYKTDACARRREASAHAEQWAQAHGYAVSLRQMLREA